MKTSEDEARRRALSVLKPGIEVTKLGKDRKDNIVSGKSPVMLFRLTLKLFRYTLHARVHILLDFSQNRWRMCFPVNGESLFSIFLNRI